MSRATRDRRRERGATRLEAQTDEGAQLLRPLTGEARTHASSC